MKKKKKPNNKKKKESGFKVKWKTWMTVVAVIAGVFVISGATVLGVFLAGGFDEKVVSPEKIDFDYGDNRFANGQVEAFQDFTLTVTSPTKAVTQRKVTLSFENKPNLLPVDGKISDGVIEIPQVVNIGSPFTVHLLTANLLDDNGDPIKDSQNNYIDWITGGLSTIVAQSEYNLADPTKINIAVDVPVYKTETIVLNSLGEEVTTVIKNERFTVKTKFIPSASEYLYSDNLSDKPENEWRKKYSFYEAVNTENLTPYYEDKTSLHFIAADKIAQNLTINGYTFTNAPAWLRFEEANANVTNAELYYTNALTFLNNNPNDRYLSSIVISIGEEEVGTFTLSPDKEGGEISMKVEEPLRLYMNEYPYVALSNYLGIKVTSTSGRLLDNLLKNIVLSFEYNGSDPTVGDAKILTVEGGKTIPPIDGVNYYKPFADVSDLRYSYFTLHATAAAKINVKVSLLINDDTMLFERSAGVPFQREFTLDITKHEEKAPVWSGDSQIDVLLDYVTIGGESTIAPKTIDLSKYVTVDEENIYKDYVFFVSFGNGKIEDFIDKANACIGESGYILSRSGNYATSGGNLTLFAVDGTSITLYNTGEFTVYVATVKKYEGQGLYNIVEMASGYKRIVCEKSLYIDSVQELAVDVSSFETEGSEVSINQGSDLTLGLSFKVGVESVPVFKDEYQKGYMTPNVYDNLGNDITELFTFDDGRLILNEDDTATLEYRLKAKSSILISESNGIYLGYASLTYDNKHSQPIKWQIQLKDNVICVYKPIAQSITIADNELKSAILNGGESIKVEQNLSAEGKFESVITVRLANGNTTKLNNINDLILRLVGEDGSYITITDQKSKTDTLKGEWKFVVKSGAGNIVGISDDKKSFNFKNTDSEDFVDVTLILQSADGNATVLINQNTDFEIDFSVKSTGITQIAFDSEERKTYETVLSEPTDDTSKATIKKYGAKGENDEFIIINNLVKFYCQGASGQQEYSNVSFVFNPYYYSVSYLSDIQITDLYGEMGMLTLYSNDVRVTFNGDYSADNIRSILASISINKIKINKNFANPHTIQLLATDSSGAVNTSVELNLLSNLSVSNASYEEKAGEKSAFKLTNTVSNYNQGTNNDKIDSLYSNATYYVILDNTDGRYKLVESATPVSGALGKYIPGGNGMMFEDFWEQASKNFTVYFEPEGSNFYTLSHPIIFTILRDMKVTKKDGAIFYSLGDKKEITDFVTVTRMDGSALTGITLSYTFDNYLLCKDNFVQGKEDADFFFDYNQDTLFTTLTIKYGNIVFSDDVEIEIQPYKSDDFYSLIAERFTLSVVEDNDLYGLTPRVQKVNNGEEDVEYLVFPTAAGYKWTYGNLTDDITIALSQRDRDNNSLRNFYTLNNNSINFTVQNNLLAGYNDSAKFIFVEFKIGGISNTSMYIPVILSSIGFDSVVYESGVESDRTLETSLMRPETLIEKEIYNEVSAGQTIKILNEISLESYKREVEDKTSWDAAITEGGLYTLAGFSQYLNVYLLDDKYENYSSLVKTIDIINGNIVLNHLSDETENVYIAFEYKIQDKKTTNNQTFYYLLKVNPDVTVEKTVYAYNGTQEFIKCDTFTNLEIDLEERFNDKTLHKDEKRFMVSKNLMLNNGTILDITNISEKSIIKFVSGDKKVIKTFDKSTDYDLSQDFKDVTSVKISIISGDVIVNYNGVEVFRTLKYKNEILSVVVGENTFTTTEGWAGHVALSISEDYRTLILRPKSNDRMTITLKHTYMGGSEDEKSVIGGEQLYTVVLNDDEEIYKVKYTESKDGKPVETETDDYEVVLRNGAVKDNTYSIAVDLIRKEQSGSTIGTTVYDKLRIEPINPELLGKDGVVNSYTYSNKRENDGLFTITLHDYIDEDKQISFAVFTDQGYLSTLTFILKANVQYSSKDSVTSLEGGKEYIVGGGKTTIGEEDVNFFNLNVANVEGYLDASTYAVTAEIQEKDSPYIKLDGQLLKVADLLEDRQATIKFTVTFNSGDIKDKTFVFTETYQLKANVFKVDSVVSDMPTIAGLTHEVQLDELVAEGCLDNSLLKDNVNISVESTSPAYAGVEGFAINTNYIASNQTLRLDITVAWPTFDANTVQTFKVSYSFALHVSVKVITNYPEPNDRIKMDYEYVEDGATFNNIVNDFIMHAPSFNTLSRVQLYRYILDKDNKVVLDEEAITALDSNDLKDLTIFVNNKSENAIVKVGDSEVRLHEKLDNSKGITFERGSASALEAKVELSITYKGVSCIYSVKIIKNSLSLVINSVTNYTQAGEYTETNTGEGEEVSTTSTVSYEKIYVDKVSTADMFAGERLVYVQTNDAMAGNADEYYFVFKDTDNYYASYPIYIAAKDQSKTLYYDLGMSFTGKTFVGLYLTSYFETAGIKLAEGRILQKTDVSDAKDILPADKNLANKVFKVVNDKPVVRLANRLQLVYGVDENNNNIEVDFSKYTMTNNNLSITSGGQSKQNEINKFEINADFTYSNGSKEKPDTQKFTASYYYMPSIDIAMTEAASTAGNYKTLEVNKEYPSLNSLLGLYHPTTGRDVSASDFSSSSDGITFRVLDYKRTDNDISVAQAYFDKYAEIEEFKSFAKTTDDIYLFHSAISNVNGCVYNYSLIPFGAKNLGDFLLCEFKYSANGFNETFYVVLKIKPDYIVTFSHSADNATQEDGGNIISNINNVDVISNVKGEVYSDFTLTGEKGYVSIKHGNGTGNKNELSIDEFTITMKQEVIDGITYNNTNNESKIFNDLRGADNKSKWEEIEQEDVTTRTYKNKKQDSNNINEDITFKNVELVIFGDQYYMFEGEDSYGYRYRMYFMLQATESKPEIKNSITVVEGDYIDLAAEYRVINPTLANSTTSEDKTQVTNNYNLNISNIHTPVSSDARVNVLAFTGIDTWQFDKDYTANNDPKTKLLDIDTTGGEEGDTVYQGATVTGEDSKTYTASFNDVGDYFNYPILQYLSIASIKLYNPTTGKPLNDKVLLNNGNASLTRAETDPWVLATNGENFFHSNKSITTTSKADEGDETTTDTIYPNLARSLYSASVKEDEGTKPVYHDNLWVMPRLTDTDIFNGAESATVRLVVQLKYKKTTAEGTIEEYVDCPINITVLRQATIIQDAEKVVQDGEVFNVNSKLSTPNGSEAKIKYFLNDTLEVLIPKGVTLTFDMELRDSADKHLEYASVSKSNTSSNFDRTYYFSLSEYFNRNVSEGDKVYIYNVSNENAKFYYITDEGSRTNVKDTIGQSEPATTETFIIGQIEEDVIYVENAALLGTTGSYGVTKHYIAVCTYSEEEGAAKYAYRSAANYIVTGRVYKLERNYNREVGFAINSTWDGTEWPEVTINDWWQNAFTLYGGTTSNGGAIDKGGKIGSINSILSYMNFSLAKADASETSVGKAAITSDGTIRLDSTFRPDQYIKVVIRLKVSGADRNIATDDTNMTYLELGTLNLSTVTRTLDSSTTT